MAQDSTATTSTPRSKQAIAGLTPPQIGEARIRESMRTVLGISPGLATLARRLQQSIIFLPLGWFILLFLFLYKLGPFVSRRYTLTNRRLMIRTGWSMSVSQEIALANIDDVRLDSNGVDPFYLAGTLEILSGGKVVMRLEGCPEPEGWRHAILNAIAAWVPGKSFGHFQGASEVKSESAAK